MNIKVPSGIKSPTVVIIGGKEPDEKHNQMAMARMDNLERKLDQQYKSFIDKTDCTEAIGKMQSSFMSNFNKMLEVNKSMMTQAHQNKIDTLKEEFKKKIKSLEDDKNNEENIKLFTSKLNSLEEAIKCITLKPRIIKVSNENNNKQLLNSFEAIFQRLETLIRQSRPRVFPTPS